MKACLPLLTTILLVISCTKEPTSSTFNPYYNLTVNGTRESVGACGTTAHVAEFSDTSAWAAFGCGGQRAGFYLKGKITDGTYELGEKNVAWYDEEPARYITDSLHKGTINIFSGNYQKDGTNIPFVEGAFSFDAIDKNSGKTIRVTNGRYFLRKY